MQSPIVENQTEKLTCPQLPLGVYREVAAHLRQIDGVEASLVERSTEPQPGAKFDYYQSQIAALKIIYTAKAKDKNLTRVQEILDYYAQRYGNWETQ